MATKGSNPNVEEKAPLPVEQKTAEKDIKPKKEKKKKNNKAFIFFLACLILVAVAVSVPSIREEIVHKAEELKANGTSALKKEKKDPPVVVVKEEISTRLEQLENARAFEQAETIIATVEDDADSNEEVRLLQDRYAMMSLEVQKLRDLIKLQDETIENLRKSIPNTGLIEERLLAGAARQDALSSQLAENSIEINKIEKNKADASAVLALMTRVDLAEQKLKTSSIEKERAAALLLALYQLREAATLGQSFFVEQQAVTALTVSSPRLLERAQVLRLTAESGVWTKSALIQSYNGFADRAALSLSLSKKKGWFHRSLNSLKELVVIRRTDVAADDMSPQAVLARAQQAVNAGDLQTAVIQLKDLTGAPAEAMKEWVVAVERYILTHKTISELISSTLGVLYADQLVGG